MPFFDGDNDSRYDHVATPQEAVNEWAWNAGREPHLIDQQWLLHDYDVWVQNPHYTGHAQGHPEDDSEAWEDTHFADGTATSVYDDGNWKAFQRQNNPRNFTRRAS